MKIEKQKNMIIIKFVSLKIHKQFNDIYRWHTKHGLQTVNISKLNIEILHSSVTKSWVFGFSHKTQMVVLYIISSVALA